MLQHLLEKKLSHASHCNILKFSGFTEHLNYYFLLLIYKVADFVLTIWLPYEGLEAFCKCFDDETYVFSLDGHLFWQSLGSQRIAHLVNILENFACKHFKYLPFEPFVFLSEAGRLVRSTHIVISIHLHYDGEKFVHILLCAFLHVQRCDLAIINGSFLKDAEEVDTVFEKLIFSHRVTEVLCQLNDDFLDC